jgi:hypothetical protein
MIVTSFFAIVRPVPWALGAAPRWHGPVSAAVQSLRLIDVSLSPDTGALPGGSTLQHLIDGLGGWALVLALAGLVIGAAAWALGSHSQNPHQSFVGRRAVIVSGLAALIIGAAPTLINFFFHTGTRIH